MLSSSSSTLNTDDETKIARIESQLKTSAAEAASHNDTTEEISSINAFESTIKPVEFIDDEAPPSLTSPTSMIVSQSNHYNYSTRGKQQSTPPVPQTITINNFNTSTNMTYNFGHTAYPYTYPPAPSVDMPSFYYPPGSSMIFNRDSYLIGQIIWKESRLACICSTCLLFLSSRPSPLGGLRWIVSIQWNEAKTNILYSIHIFADEFDPWLASQRFRGPTATRQQRVK